MTVLAAMHESGVGTWIGSDTHARMGAIKFNCRPKWVIGDHWAVGCAGDARLQNLIESRVVPKLTSENDAFAVTDSIRDALKEDGWNTTSEPGALDFGAWLLLANPTGVWATCSAFSVDQINGYWADGSGSQVAMGAMYAASMSEMAPEHIVRMGIMAAMEHERGCGGEVWIERLPLTLRVAAE